MAKPSENHGSAGLAERLLRRLDSREQELRRLIAGEHERATVELFSDLDGVVGDEADQAFAKTRAGVETELVDRHLRELEQIEAARTRIQSGAFDTCVDCGGPIGAARLEAILSATRCTDCQSRREKYAYEARKLPA
jgi:RNA polymerase-binding transcription factor DksA